MISTLRPLPAPELVFGLVAPIGVDLDLVTHVLSATLQEMDYRPVEFRLTDLMREVPVGLDLSDKSYVQSYRQRIAYANAVRAGLGDDALASLAISAIRAYRARQWTSAPPPAELSPVAINGKKSEEIPLPSSAYILWQFKRPEEILLLRSIYGRQFILISAYSPQETRRKRIEERERQSCGGLISDVEAYRLAHGLISQDAREALDSHGQNLRDAFPLGDVFIDATSKSKCESDLRRFIHLIFGSNEITPTHDEYGMYMAKSASLRSSDLSRQVGAAIFNQTGEVIALGCNEVPKAGGGTYWTGDRSDRRDFVQGYDPNERGRLELLVDLIDRLQKGQHLSEPLMQLADSYQISTALLTEREDGGVADSKVMDVIEFGRIIHAEMSAITDAARNGTRVHRGTLYCTTFPCHICAKHIVAAGIQNVVYLEPYPKSYAADLHSDSVEVDGDGKGGKVNFAAFIGISPFRYRELFEKGKRKYSGKAQSWNRGERRPMIDVYFPSYFEGETYVIAQLREKLELLFKSAGSETASPSR